MVCSALLSRHAACPFPCQPSNAGTSGRVHTGKPAQLRARTLRVSAGSDHEFSRRDVGLLLSGALCLSADKASAGGPDEEGRVALATEREVQNFSKYQQQVRSSRASIQSHHSCSQPAVLALPAWGWIGCLSVHSNLPGPFLATSTDRTTAAACALAVRSLEKKAPSPIPVGCIVAQVSGHCPLTTSPWPPALEEPLV